MKLLYVSQELINAAVESHLKALSMINDNDVVESVWHDLQDRPVVYLKKE